MVHSEKRIDVITKGRWAVDFYRNAIGRLLKFAKSFNVYVGGCPANVAVGTQRLALRSAIVTRAGTHPLGNFMAIVVTRHACANDMPYGQLALDFVAARGGC